MISENYSRGLSTFEFLHSQARIGQRHPLTRFARHHQKRAHRAGRPHAHRVHRRLDVSHGVIHGETAGDQTTRRIDVEMDRLVRIIGLQEPSTLRI